MCSVFICVSSIHNLQLARTKFLHNQNRDFELTHKLIKFKCILIYKNMSLMTPQRIQNYLNFFPVLFPLVWLVSRDHLSEKQALQDMGKHAHRCYRALEKAVHPADVLFSQQTNSQLFKNLSSSNFQNLSWRSNLFKKQKKITETKRKP